MTDSYRSGDHSSLAVGIDVVSIPRFAGILEEYRDRLLNHAYTSAEQRYCDSKAAPAQHYAVRWAVKEAYVKAVTTDDHIRFTDIEIVHKDAIELEVTDTAYEALTENYDCPTSDVHIDLSMSHSKESRTAVGTVVILKASP